MTLIPVYFLFNSLGTRRHHWVRSEPRPHREMRMMLEQARRAREAKVAKAKRARNKGYTHGDTLQTNIDGTLD